MKRQFIPARAEDNPSLLTYDPDYLDRVEAMGHPALVLAMREGNWDVVIGSMFGYIFRRRRHVCTPFAIPVTWDIWRGGDDGFNEPASVHWVTMNPDTGTFYVIAELYAKHMLPDEFATRTLNIDRSIKIFFGGMSDVDISENDMPLEGDMDSAAFAEIGTSREHKSRGSELNKRGCNWKPVSKAKADGIGFRAMRAQLMHAVLAPNPRERRKDTLGEKMPGLQIFPSCVNLIRILPQLPADEDDPECVDSDTENHAYDSLTYGLLRKKRFVLFRKAA